MDPHVSEPVGPTPKTLVVPLDGSDFAGRAVPVAAEVARRFDADVVLVTAPTAIRGDDVDTPPDWLDDLANSVGNARIETVVAHENDPVGAVLNLVATRPEPVVAMATHGRGVVGTAALGSVAQQIVRAAGVPLLLVGRDCLSSLPWTGPVVVCHDGSSFADAALAPALTWAGALGLPIALVHVFHPLDVATAEAPTAAIRDALATLGPGTAAHVVRGSRPVDGIVNVADETGASLVVMSTHGHTGLGRVVLGSVAMATVRSSPCPVLVTRPWALDH